MDGVEIDINDSRGSPCLLKKRISRMSKNGKPHRGSRCNEVGEIQNTGRGRVRAMQTR